MTLTSRQDYVDFVERRYFGSLMRGDVAAALACFAPDARVTLRHGDAPERHFAVTPGAATPLKDFFDHLCRTFDVWFGDFSHVVDVAERRSAATFRVVLTPKKETAEGGKETLFNCNFFHFEGNGIARMVIYYCNPNVGDDRSAPPTGYPIDRN